MKTELIDYYLPEERIALEPVAKRDDCRLLVLHRETGNMEHKKFVDILDYLSPQDVLVLNDTRVIHARVFAQRATGAKVEILLLHSEDKIHWTALTTRSKRLKIQEELILPNGITAKILNMESNGIKTLLFSRPLDDTLLCEIGEIPLPPYIKNKRNPDTRDEIWYQTVFSKNTGSMASPTAGLHFSQELLDRAREKGVIIQYVTLHISLATFHPIRTTSVEEHKIHEEYYSVSQETSDTVRYARKNGNKVIAVGTTAVRSLESASKTGEIMPSSGFTDLYITPGYAFKSCDAIITNFHTPCSTLLVLVSAFASLEKILSAYQTAIEMEYRFLSYGDAMLIT